MNVFIFPIREISIWEDHMWQAWAEFSAWQHQQYPWGIRCILQQAEQVVHQTIRGGHDDKWKW